MPTFNLDPSEGPHAGANLTDRELEFLQQMLAVELAIRLGKADYQQRFHDIASHRVEMDDMVIDWRRQRDQMAFVESVTSDLNSLPVLEDR